jgi:hypothetical protein
MASEVLSGGLGEIRAVSTAGGGTALSTTAVYIPLTYQNAHHLFITPRNFATAVVAKFSLNPWLTVLKTADAMATAPTDYSVYAQDGAVSPVITLSALGTYANGDYVLLGSHAPIRGFRGELTANVNVDASVMTVYYWNGTAWADTSATDGTISPAGTTLGADGIVYWTPPTAIRAGKLVDMLASCTTGTGTVTSSPVALKPERNVITMTVTGTCTVCLPPGATGYARSGTATVVGSPQSLVAGNNTVDITATTGTLFIDYSITTPIAQAYISQYWYQVRFSVALDAATTLEALLAMNQSTAYAELISGQTFEEKINVGPGGFGCVEALTDAGTANLIVNVAAANGGRLS